ncbi:helix-turn-helix domain-containing protein [Bermanella marisrubri]|uniref:Transcriptional regulator, AraC family protein n=1 Tax=Bermanella marisrubri TaxID=207949 RepID=Q1N3Z6_9GAMM|nr:helix-turn-helix domain-containing protein [Bermanella marisrubri]EAT13069.1 transcriptional regulator, AraC family protein [Oceanobacter sp. RED65] [Bermanella marisrubri]QIZ82815.1 helix-turn-helix domain-containing protein [Bermanella marisrubri]
MSETGLNKRPIEIAFLIPDQFWSSTITSFAEVFHGMQLNAKLFQNNEFKGINSTFLRCTDEPVNGFSGLNVGTERFDAYPGTHFDVIIVPSVWDLSVKKLELVHDALLWLRQQHDAGCRVIGLVTGVFFLAEAGILDGKQASVHWASKNTFKQRFPKVQISDKSDITQSGHIITTSTTPAIFDVILLIIQHFLGDRSADMASLYFTFRDRDEPVPFFIEPDTKDTVVEAAREYIRMNYTRPIKLQELAQQLNVTQRTLTRRFNAALGETPIAYLLSYRLKIAKNLLKSTDYQVQQIAEQTGHASATVFCRNFKSMFGCSPKEYRKDMNQP